MLADVCGRGSTSDRSCGEGGKMMRVRRLGLVGAVGVVIVGMWTWWSLVARFQQVPRSSEEQHPREGVPALRLSASEVDMGEVPSGSRREASLVLTNVGTAPVKISEIRTEGRFALVRAPLLPARIGPGVRVRVNVVFSSDRPGAAMDRLRIVSDAPSGTLVVPLRAVAVGDSMARAGGKRGRCCGTQASSLPDSIARVTGKRGVSSAARPVRATTRVLKNDGRASGIRLPLPEADPGALPVAWSLSELTAFLHGSASALQPVSDEVLLEVGGASRGGLRP
jgi:hypothetical protein